MTKPTDAMDGGVTVGRKPAVPSNIFLIGYERHAEDNSGNASSENKAAATVNSQLTWTNSFVQAEEQTGKRGFSDCRLWSAVLVLIGATGDRAAPGAQLQSLLNTR